MLDLSHSELCVLLERVKIQLFWVFFRGGALSMQLMYELTGLARVEWLDILSFLINVYSKEWMRINLVWRWHYAMWSSGVSLMQLEQNRTKLRLSTVMPRYWYFSTSLTSWLFLIRGDEGSFFFSKIYWHVCLGNVDCEEGQFAPFRMGLQISA